MIYGVTHDPKTGDPREKLSVGVKVSIGLPAQPGRNYPQKLDHFFIARHDGKGEWVEHAPLTNALKEKYSPEIEVKGTKQRAPLRQFDIVFLNDDIESVFRTEYAWWNKSEKRCSGDGKAAMRSTEIVPDDLKKQYPNQKRIPWSPCGEGCPDLRQGNCKPSGALYFMLADQPVIGSVAAYFTTSYTTILQICSSLRQIQSLTGGRLRGIRLKMVLRPGKTRYKDKDGKLKSGNAFFVSIEFRPEDHARLLPELMEQSLVYAQAKAIQTKGLKLLSAGAPTATPDIDVEPLTEPDQAAVMGAEFYPADTVDEEHEEEGGPDPDGAGREVDPAADEETQEIDNICSDLGINQAKKELVLAGHGGDISGVLEFFQKFQEECKRLNATAAEVSDWVTRGGANPDWLFGFLRDFKREEKGAKKREKSAPAEAAKSAQPATESAKDNTPASGGDLGKFNF